MKKITKLFIVMLSCLMFTGSITPALAHETSLYSTSENVIVISESNLEELDQYVNVEDNRYVLSLPDNVIISDELKQEVLERMKNVSDYIDQQGLHIDPDTGLATQTVYSRAYGVNSVTMSWNYFNVKLDAGVVRIVVKAGIAGCLAALKVAFPPLAAFLVANPVSGVSAMAILGSIANSVAELLIQDGVEIHYNFFYRKITTIKAQK